MRKFVSSDEFSDCAIEQKELCGVAYKKLREIVKLRRSVEAEFEFYCEQERKAVEDHGERDARGAPVFLPDGRLKLKDVRAKEAFDAEIGRLLDTEVDDFTAVTIRESDFLSADDLPTPGDMLLLENIITFED